VKAWKRRVATRAALLCLAIVLALPLVGRAEEVAVPVALQAQLLAKVASYDRHFGARSGERAKVLLVVMPGNSESSRKASEMQRELGSIAQIAGLSHDETVSQYSGAASLKATCENEHIAIVYIGPGFGAEIDAIRDALGGVDVLTASAVADHVQRGIVLGFDLVSGKPKLLVNLTQARAQNVDFSSSVLKLMKVYE
jgi:hypothetical protein